MVREELIERMFTGVVDSVVLAHCPRLRKNDSAAVSCEQNSELV